MAEVALQNARAAHSGAAAVEEFHNYIDGVWARSGSNRTFDNVNPADTSDIVGRFQASTAADARAAVDAAAAAFEGWRRTSVSARAKVLNRAADYLDAHADRFAKEMTREQGKALNLAKDEIVRSAQCLRFYAVEATSLAGETFPNDDPDMTVYTLREPLGVVSVITPRSYSSFPPEFSFSASPLPHRIYFSRIARTERTFLFSNDTILFVDAITPRLTNAGLRQKPKNVVPLLFVTLECSAMRAETTEMVCSVADQRSIADAE